MSYRTTRAARSTIALSATAFLIAVPSAAAARVDLGTSSTFVVLGGSAVTNTGPSVLNGALGVSPGTSLSGFGLPAVVNGATHANDAVAAQAQADATTAFGVAAGEPVSPANVLTGTDLGSRTLLPGAYSYATSAQLTGALTLDAGGDPNAQFIVQIGSTLTTASGSSVVLTNSASACNVFWQIGSSATLGTGTALQGNLMALASITLTSGSTLVGRALAQTGAVTLDNAVMTAPSCPTPVVPPALDVAPPAGVSAVQVPASPAPATTQTPGTDAPTPSLRIRRVPGGDCVDPFLARVRGTGIASVAFRLDGKPIGTRTRAPFTIAIDAGTGRHRVLAVVEFTDGTAAKRLHLRYRRCDAAILQPRRGPSSFTG